jgi:hypothetical protein
VTFERESVITIYEREAVTQTFEREAVVTTFSKECKDMIVPEFKKQPWEQFFLGAEFANVLDTDVENIDLANSTITAVDVSGDTDNTVLDIGSKALESDTILKVRISAGAEAKSPYKFTFKIVTTQNNKWEKDISMSVEDL